MEAIRRRHAEQQARKLRQRELMKQRLKRLAIVTGQRAVIWAVAFALLLALSTAVFFLNLHMHHTKNDSYSYIVGNYYDEHTTAATSYNALYRKGYLYLPMSDIADLYGFTVTGDVSELRLLFNNDAGDVVRFTMDDPVASINGMPVRLPCAPYYRSGEFYLPAEFFTRYITGISITEDAEKHRVILARSLTPECQQHLADSLDEKGRLTNTTFPFVYEDTVSVRLHRDTPSASIEENRLSPDILLETDEKYQIYLAAMRKEKEAAVMAAPDEEKLAVAQEYDKTMEEYLSQRLAEIDMEIAQAQLALSKPSADDNPLPEGEAGEHGDL